VTQESKVRFDVRGREGSDTMNLQATGVNIDASSQVVAKVHGGEGNNVITANYQGQVHGALGVHLGGGVANDTVTSNISVDAGSTGEVYATVQGSAGNDNLTLNVTGAGTSTLQDLDAYLDGGPGTDTCTATPNVVVENCES